MVTPPLLPVQRFPFIHGNLINTLSRPFKFGIQVCIGKASKSIVALTILDHWRPSKRQGDNLKHTSFKNMLYKLKLT